VVEDLTHQRFAGARQMVAVMEAGEATRIHIEPEGTHAVLNVGNMTEFEDMAAGKGGAGCRE